MPETSFSSKTPAKKRRGLKLSDVIIFVIFAIVIIVLVKILTNQLSLRHEVSAARATSDQLISAMQTQNGSAARKLGDAGFQAAHSDTQLNGLFKQSKPYTTGTPTVVKQTVTNGSASKVVSVYYKFGSSKPFYVRTTVKVPNGATTWHLINFSGDNSLNSLTK